jgi:orotate phosphoribosyltransferase-like protein
LEGINSAHTNLNNDVVPLIEIGLTVEEVAERLGISVEAATALVAASLRSNSCNEAQ